MSELSKNRLGLYVLVIGICIFEFVCDLDIGAWNLYSYAFLLCSTKFITPISKPRTKNAPGGMIMIRAGE